jgi:hypothetical protein
VKCKLLRNGLATEWCRRPTMNGPARVTGWQTCLSIANDGGSVGRPYRLLWLTRMAERSSRPHHSPRRTPIGRKGRIKVLIRRLCPAVAAP